jgi:fatty-acyl-CoA synthase
VSIDQLATDVVAYHAVRHPDSPALEGVDDGVTRTWSELEARVSAVAGVLAHRCGVGAGDRVVALTENDLRFFELQFALMRLRAILVPLNWRLAPPELRGMVADASPRLIVHDLALREVARELGENLATPCLSWGCDDGELDFETEVASATPVAPSRDALLTDLTHILYTSGSTGVPKGVMLSRENMVWNFLNSQGDKAMTGLGTKMYNPMPNFHAGGLSALANPILLSGGSVAVAQRVDADQMVQIMGDPSRGMTHSTGVVTIYQMMVDSKGWVDADFSSMRYTECGGGRIPAALAASLREKGLVLQSVYGATETGPAAMQMPRDSAASRPTSIGLAVPFTQVRLVGVDGNDVGTGEIGEIWLSGPSITPGYWGSDRESDPSFEGPWFKTGDAARVDVDGFYEAVDRFKRMYKTGGENVFPAEVEALLIEHPDIREIAIIGVPDQRWGETGHAIVSTRPARTIDLTDIAAFAAGKIAKYKLPTRLTVVPELPHNANGKVDLKLLDESYR